MREPGNISALAELRPDYMGFIFYPGSKRYVGEDFELPYIPAGIRKTGVFVNQDMEIVMEKVECYGLDAVQLHGSEDPAFAVKLKDQGIEVIKAFGLSEDFDFTQLEAYAGRVDYYLFDTKTPAHGGSGKTFDWDVLKKYALDVPFFLSGGIGPATLKELKAFTHPKWIGLDVNSAFETGPAVKDIERIKSFKEELSKAI